MVQSLSILGSANRRVNGVSGSHILIAEDETITAKSIEDSLCSFGYTVSGIVSTGEDAVSQAKATEPDLVLMDIRLRGNLDGVEAACRIRKQFGIPVVYLTAYADDETLERAKSAEPFGYLVKPFLPETLNSTIEISLSKRAKEKKLQESEERFRLMFDRALDAIVLQTPNGGILAANRAACILTGYSHRELLSKTIADLIPAECSAEFVGKSRRWKGGSPPTLETVALCQDGTSTPVELTLTPFRVSGDLLFLTVARDISERKRADDERDRFVADLKEELANVRTLDGMLPICASCKSIRDADGYWRQVEMYVQEHTNAEFTHGICPDCLQKLYPPYSKDGETC